MTGNHKKNTTKTNTPNLITEDTPPPSNHSANPTAPSLHCTMFRIATNACLSGAARRSIQSKSRRIFSTGGKPEAPANSAAKEAPPAPASTAPPPAAQAPSSARDSIKYAKTTAGTGAPDGAAGGAGAQFSTRGPVTWPALGLVAIAAGSAVAYYRIERERRLENAMGKIVSLSSLFVSAANVV